MLFRSEPGGRTIAALGEIETRTWYRSAAKPFQTIAMIESGAADVFGMTSAELAACMHDFAEMADLLGRAGNYAHLAFAVDTDTPEHGARLMRVEERSTAINTRLLWFELEWAALDDTSVDDLLADPALD